jgi:hypothetical protein
MDLAARRASGSSTIGVTAPAAMAIKKPNIQISSLLLHLAYATSPPLGKGRQAMARA